MTDKTLQSEIKEIEDEIIEPGYEIISEKEIKRDHYEGVARLAKDPQRLHNFQMSYLANIASPSLNLFFLNKMQLK